MKKVCTLLLVVLVTSGCCSTIDHSRFMGKMTDEKNLTTADVTICKGGFIEIGMDCAELQGYPRLVHPMLLTYFCCTVNWYNDGEVVRSVILISNDWALEHELQHAKGYPDLVNTQESTNPVVVRDIGEKTENMVTKYADKCYPLNNYLLAMTAKKDATTHQ